MIQYKIGENEKMSLSFPKCNNFRIQNQNPYYVVLCNLEKKLVMTDHCRSCKENGSNADIDVFYEEGGYHIRASTQKISIIPEKKQGLDLFFRNK